MFRHKDKTQTKRRCQLSRSNIVLNCGARSGCGSSFVWIEKVIIFVRTQEITPLDKENAIYKYLHTSNLFFAKISDMPEKLVKGVKMFVNRSPAETYA